MREPDDHELDVVLRSVAGVESSTEDQERIFSDVWSRVQGVMSDDAEASPGDVAEQRRLSLMGDRDVAPRPRRGAAKVASVALAVALVGSGTAAAAGFLSTRTGQHNSGWEIEAGGPGEILNTGGTDRDQVFDEVTADIPFAPGYEAQRTWALEFHPMEADSAISEGTLRSWMAGTAVCTWADAWVAADNVGDVGARATATTVLAEAVSWKDIVEFDFPDGVRSDTGESRSYRWWVRPLADAARSGDRAALLDTVAQSATCSHHVLPVIDVAPDYVYAGVR